MLKRILLALALIGALAACTPGGGATTSSPALSTPAPSLDESPSGMESMEPSESPSAS